MESLSRFLEMLKIGTRTHSKASVIISPLNTISVTFGRGAGTLVWSSRRVCRGRRLGTRPAPFGLLVLILTGWGFTSFPREGRWQDQENSARWICSQNRCRWWIPQPNHAVIGFVVPFGPPWANQQIPGQKKKWLR